MYEEQFRIRKWSGWWYLERSVRRCGGWSWGGWGHVAANPNRQWLIDHYPVEVKRADNR